MSGRRDKRPGRIADPKSRKIPRGGGKAEAYEQERFRWRTQSIDCEGLFGWANVSPDLLFRHIIPKLHDREMMPWQEVIKDGSHACDVAGMEKPARDRLAELEMDDHDTLFSLRISGRQRVWGVRDRGMFNLLWWDPEHQVYLSKKRNT